MGHGGQKYAKIIKNPDFDEKSGHIFCHIFPRFSLYGGFYFVPIPKWTPLIRVSSAKKSYEGTRNGSLFNS